MIRADSSLHQDVTWQPVTVTLLGEPTAQGRARFTQKGRPYTPAKTRNAAAALRVVASQEMIGRLPFAGPVKVDLFAEIKMPRTSLRKTQEMICGDRLPITKPDLSNYLKLAEDALNGVVFVDDKQICELHCSKRYGVQPKLVITVSAA